MDLTAFETWLGEIAALTEPQRRRAWQALAFCSLRVFAQVGSIGKILESLSSGANA